jgi:hypothetical protein
MENCCGWQRQRYTDLGGDDTLLIDLKRKTVISGINDSHTHLIRGGLNYNLAVGYFLVHRHDPIKVRDVPYIYTLCFLLLLFIGAGTLSLDHLLYQFI